MGTQKISKEMQSFQAAVQKLSGKIGQASSLWRDAKYSELSASVGQIATQSRDVLIAADRCHSAVDKFDKIALEEY